MALHPDTIEQLASTRTIELTTTGRRSGQATRIEIWWFRVDNRFIITGTPGRRDWFANVAADPSVIIHGPFGDFAGRAVAVTNDEFRRRVMTHPDLSWYQTQSELEALVEGAPMIEITLDETDARP